MSQSNPNPVESPIEDKSLSASDVVDFLSEEVDEQEQETLELEKDSKKSGKTSKEAKEEGDEKEEKDDDKEEKEDKSLEDELEEELEEESKSPDEEELELITPVRRKEILAKYPTLFKDFPALERAYYREQKYGEVFPTIDDAKNAAEKAETLDSFEDELSKGSTETILAAVRENDKAAFAKLVDNYLPTLHKVDEAAYYHTIGNIVKHTIISMVQDGKASQSDELIQAADILNQYIFGTKTFSHPTKLSTDDKREDNEKETELNEREKRFIEREFNTAKDNVISRIDNVINSTIDKHIDPKGSMSAYVKKNAVREAGEALESYIEKDKRFREIYDRLWEKAAADNFSAESMDRIKTAYLSKAKTLLPEIIKKIRSEALRASGSRDSDERDRKGPLPVGKTRGSAPSSKSTKSAGEQAKQIPRGMSTLDFLSSD